MERKIIYGSLVLLLVFYFLIGCSTSRVNEGRNTQNKDPFLQKMEENDGDFFSGNSRGPRQLHGTPYSYEIWSESAHDNRLIWYGPNYSGGAAFRAEWTNAHVFLDRVGLLWNEGKPFTDYGNVFCDFAFTRSENGTAGGTSYIGIYGWSRNPMIEWYIVEDWFSSGVITPSRIGGGATKVGEFTIDGAVYFIYHATRPAGAGNINGTNDPFPQFFSVRQTTRQSGTISITEHFKEWEKAGLQLGTNMYEAKFLIEAGRGTGWFDASHISFYQKD